MATATSIRLKVLKATQKQPHRYTKLRFLSMSVSIVILAAVPLLGVAQVDFWGGHHHVLLRPAPFRVALAGVIIGIALMYVVTFLSNVVAGRLFCGWGCPVGQVSRLGEQVDTPGQSRRRKWLAQVNGGLFSIVFVLAVLAWWVDLRVLIWGAPRALAVSWGLVCIGTLGAYLHGRWWRWAFCKSVCPIGLYYSIVSPARYFGVHFRNQDQSCIECNACDHVCPVDLKPRDLTASVTDRVGVSIADAPGFNHCLECGDCIVACEMMVSLRSNRPGDTAPLHLGWFNGPQRIDHDPAESSAESSAVSSP